MANRSTPKTINDGSLSDTYSDIKEYSSYSMWLRHSNTSSRLSDGSETIMSRNQRLLQHRNSTQSPIHKLNRSNSIRYFNELKFDFYLSEISFVCKKVSTRRSDVSKV